MALNINQLEGLHHHNPKHRNNMPQIQRGGGDKSLPRILEISRREINDYTIRI